MTIDKWKAQGSPEEIEWFKLHVKCCFNCSHWLRDHITKSGFAISQCMEHDCHTWWDNLCKKYSGSANDNLLDYADIKDNYMEDKDEL